MSKSANEGLPTEKYNLESHPIKEHDFQNAKKSLKKFSEKAKEQIELNSVRTDGGFLWLGDHKVTGTELNTITSQIQDYLIKINQLNQDFVDEFGQVYKAFEALDKDYICWIVAAIKSIEKVHENEADDRATIKKTISLLLRFQNDLEKVKHLTDVDTIWELTEKQKTILASLEKYKSQLSALNHLDDVDKMWEKSTAQAEALERLNESFTSFDKTLQIQSKTLSNFSGLLEEFQQKLQDVDALTQKKLEETQSSVNQRFAQFEQNFRGDVDALYKDFDEKQALLEENFESRFSIQDEALDAIKETQIKRLTQISQSQEEHLASIQKAQQDTLDELQKKQSSSLMQLEENQTNWFTQVSQEQNNRLSEINTVLAKETKTLHAQVAELKMKIKISYITTGGVAVLTILHFVLSFAGIL